MTTTATQTGTTDDGRKVILSSDGTWQYGNKDAVVPTVPVKENSTLQFETGLVLGSGDVKPVSRTTFYLLDKSIASIIVDESLLGKKIKVDDYVYDHFLTILGHVLSNDWHYAGEARIASVMAALKPHVIQAVTTDFSGKATLKRLPAGTYWLLGFTTISNDCIIWDLKTELSPGDNSVILDNNNSARILKMCM